MLTANRSVQVMSLLSSPTAHLTNLLTVPLGRQCPHRRRESAGRTPASRDGAIGTKARTHWRQSLAFGKLRLGALVFRQPGHRASENFEFTVLSGWRLTF